MPRPNRILVDSIRIDGGTQTRVAISDETVADYAEAMKAGTKFPPVRVVFDGADYWLWDGFHRVHALLRISRVDCDALVQKGTRDDAVWLATSANRENGLRRTRADKRKAVEVALGVRGQESDRSIAEHVGVSHTFVSELRQSCSLSRGNVATCQPSAAAVSHRMNGEQPEKLSPGKARVGRDGKNYVVSDGPPALPTGIDPRSYTLDQTPLSPLPTSPTSSAAAFSSASDDAGEPEDGVGQPIPEVVQARYRSAREWANAWLRRCSELTGEITKLHEAGDERVKTLNTGVFDSSVQRIRFEIREKCRPHAVCPMCSGHGSPGYGCRPCASRGWMSEREWAAVAEEFKPASARRSVPGPRTDEHGGDAA